MATQKVNIDIQTKGAKKSKDELAGLTGAISKVAKAAGIASAAFFGAKKLIDAFSVQEIAEKKLRSALGRTSQSLLDQASALQRLSMVGDEQIIVQQAFLASLKFTEDQIKTIIPVALDLSAATGISLDSSVRNLAKTFSGLQGELGELIPQLRELTSEQLQQGEAVKIVSQLMGGQAREQSETMTGSIQQAKMAVGDLAQELGGILAPAVKLAAGAMADFIGGIEGKDFISDMSKQSLLEFIESLEKQREEFKVLMDQGIGPARQAYNEFSQQIEEARSKLEELEKPLQSSTTIFATQTDILKLRNTLLQDGVLSIQDHIDINKTNLESVKEQIRQGLNVIANQEKQLELEGKLIKLRNDLKSATISSTAQMAESFSKLNESSKGSAIVTARLAQASAIIDTYAGANKAFAQGGVLGFATSASIIAAGLANVITISRQIGDLKGFAEGGIVPGTGNTDSVPAMLTPGEVILNAAQQENLVGGMGNNISVTINAPLVDETVVDSIIPAIQTALNEDRATLRV